MKLAELLDAARRKWPMSARIFFAASVVLGIGAFTLMSGYRRQLEEARPDLGPPATVVVASHDLVRGAPVGPADLLVRTLPADVLPPGSIVNPSQTEGRVLLAGMRTGEVLTQTRLAPRGSGPLAALVSPGLKAVVVPSNLPADAVHAGDTIDVLTTFGGAHAHTETSATGVQILAVLAGGPENATDIGTTGGPQLVLLVDATAASSLSYAAAFGHIAIAVDPAEVTGSQETGLPPAPTGS